jgi:hypothetical protein
VKNDNKVTILGWLGVERTATAARIGVAIRRRVKSSPSPQVTASGVLPEAALRLSPSQVPLVALTKALTSAPMNR